LRVLQISTGYFLLVFSFCPSLSLSLSLFFFLSPGAAAGGCSCRSSRLCRDHLRDRRRDDPAMIEFRRGLPIFFQSTNHRFGLFAGGTRTSRLNGPAKHFFFVPPSNESSPYGGIERRPLRLPRPLAVVRHAVIRILWNGPLRRSSFPLAFINHSRRKGNAY